jgi:hypothetical protein
MRAHTQTRIHTPTQSCLKRWAQRCYGSTTVVRGRAARSTAAPSPRGRREPQRLVRKHSAPGVMRSLWRLLPGLTACLTRNASNACAQLQDSHGCRGSRRPPREYEEDGAGGSLQYRVDKLVALACAQLDMLNASECMQGTE